LKVRENHSLKFYCTRVMLFGRLGSWIVEFVSSCGNIELKYTSFENNIHWFYLRKSFL